MHIPLAARTILFSLRSAFARFYHNKMANHAGAVAYFFLLSVFPASLLTIAVIDTWLSSYGELQERFFQLLGYFNADLNREFFSKIGLQRVNPSTIGVVGILTLLWSSRLGLASVQSTMDIIFPSEKPRNAFVGMLLSFLVVPSLVLLVFVSGILRALSVVIMQTAREIIPVDALPLPLDEVFTFVTPFIMVTLVGYFAYRFLPKNNPRKTPALIGSAGFALSFFILKLAFSDLVMMSSANMVYGSIATIILLLFFVYSVFMLFFLFAELIYVYDHLEIAGLECIITNTETFGITRRDFLRRSPFKLFQRYGRKVATNTPVLYQNETDDVYLYILNGSITVTVAKSEELEIRHQFKKGDLLLLQPERKNLQAFGNEPSQVLLFPHDVYRRLMLRTNLLTDETVTVKKI